MEVNGGSRLVLKLVRAPAEMVKLFIYFYFWYTTENREGGSLLICLLMYA